MIKPCLRENVDVSGQMAWRIDNEETSIVKEVNDVREDIVGRPRLVEVVFPNGRLGWKAIRLGLRARKLDGPRLWDEICLEKRVATAKRGGISCE